MGVLETAMKIANQDADAEDEEEDGHEEAAKVKRRMGGKKTNSGTAKWPNCVFCSQEI